MQRNKRISFNRHAHNICQRRDYFFHALFFSHIDQAVDTVKRIVQKMRVDLCLQRFQLGILRQYFLKVDRVDQMVNSGKHIIIHDAKLLKFVLGLHADIGVFIDLARFVQLSYKPGHLGGNHISSKYDRKQKNADGHQDRKNLNAKQPVRIRKQH